MGFVSLKNACCLIRACHDIRWRFAHTRVRQIENLHCQKEGMRCVRVGVSCYVLELRHVISQDCVLFPRRSFFFLWGSVGFKREYCTASEDLKHKGILCYRHPVFRVVPMVGIDIYRSVEQVKSVASSYVRFTFHECVSAKFEDIAFSFCWGLCTGV